MLATWHIETPLLTPSLVRLFPYFLILSVVASMAAAALIEPHSHARPPVPIQHARRVMRCRKNDRASERERASSAAGAAIIWPPSMSVCVRPRPNSGPSPPPPPSSSSSLNYSISFPLVPSLNSVADPACPNATAAAASARAKERFHRAIVARARRPGRVGGGGEPGRGPWRGARHAGVGGIPHSHLAAGEG